MRDTLNAGGALAMRVLMLIVVLLMSGAGPAVAGPYEDGVAAQEKGDYAAAASSYRIAAEQGHAKAQLRLGSLYESGWGVKQDYAEAAKWYRKSADQGDAKAQNHLAGSYEQGHGVPKDDVAAVSWYLKAANQGDTYAQIRLGDWYRIGKGVPQDGAMAISWYRRAADQGENHATSLIGIMYEQGRIVQQDNAEAMKWYRKAAERGDTFAQNNLGAMYADGRGTAQNYTAALSWHRKAADQGYARAQNDLGLMYAKGQGVPQDYVQAHKWWNLAASRFATYEKEGRETAVANRDFVATKMTPAQIAEAQKLAREWKPTPSINSSTTSAPIPAPVRSDQQIGPSFDCTAKTVATQPLAQMICRNRTLAYVELSYVIAYQALRESSTPAVRKAMVDDANALVVAINDECNIPKTGSLLAAPTEANVQCIKARFDRQRADLISRLSGAARDEGVLEPAETIAIQKALQAKSYLPATAELDGVFGPVSRQAVLAWQKDNSLPETGFGSKAMLAALTGRPQANTTPSTTYPYPPPAAPSPRAPTPGPEVHIGSDVVKECIVGQIAKLSITGESANAVASAAISLCNETMRRDLANHCAAKERACNPADLEKRVIEIIAPRVAALVMQFRAEAAQQQVKEKGPSPGSPQQNIAGPFEEGQAAYRKGDYATALRLWRPLAEWGFADAQHELGVMYALGLGVPQDSTTALSWYRKAAEQGDAKFQSSLAFTLSLGVGVPRDPAESVKWYRKAAEQGDAHAQASLGDAYRTGEGVPQDHSQAAVWYRKAAEQGDARAQNALGKMYANGRGVQQDYVQAASWFRKAAEQGDAFAQNALGKMYENGEGVMQDYVRAYQWYDLAVSRLAEIKKELRLPIGDRDEVREYFIADRNIVAAKMTSAQIAEAQNLAREWKPKQAIVSPATPTASAPPPQRSTSGSSIPMKKDGGTYVVPVLINNAITLDFTVDSGATDVTIPEDVVTTLIRAGTIRDTDFIGEQIYVLADGSRVKSKTFRIRSLKVGDHVLENVTGSVASTKGSLLLGQSFLGRFKSWSIDNNKHVLVLE